MIDEPKSISEILTSLGYSLNTIGKTFRCRPIYRDSNNNMSLSISKENGRWIDFGTSETGNFEELIKITLGLKTHEQVKEVLTGQFQYVAPVYTVNPQIKQPKKFSRDLLAKLVRNHSYWNNRGISDEVLDLFNGGTSTEGKMKDRYVFPIFDEQSNLIGASGRDLAPHESRPKWKHVGEKSQWIYPMQAKDMIMQERRVIIVESIGDMLTLWENGIKSVLVAFGIEVGIGLLNALIRLDPEKIFLSFNNEPGNAFIGNLAAEKQRNKLYRYFDEEQIKIALPPKKDFNEMMRPEILQWEREL